eukprot:g2439.t1
MAADNAAEEDPTVLFQRLNRYGFIELPEAEQQQLSVDTVTSDLRGEVAAEEKSRPRRSSMVGDGRVTATSARTENVRTLKWVSMLRDWQKVHDGHRGATRTLRRRVRKGIPDAVRGRAWYLMSGAADCRLDVPDGDRLYADLLRRWDGLSSSMAQIDALDRARDDALREKAQRMAAAAAAADKRRDEEGGSEKGPGGRGAAGGDGSSSSSSSSSSSGGSSSSSSSSSGGGARNVLQNVGADGDGAGESKGEGRGSGGGGGGDASAADFATGAAVDPAVMELARKLHEWDAVIQVDAPRTFPNHVLYKQEGGEGQKRLMRVLRAHAVHDPDFGYTQGVNFIAGILLCYMTEEDVFWVVWALLRTEPYHLRELFMCDKVPLVPTIWYQMEQLGKVHLPKLFAHFDREGVMSSMYMTEWFMTLFTRSFPFDLVTRVWDSFIYDGWKIVFRVMLALLKLAAPALMNESLEGIMRKIHHVPQQIGHDAEKVWRVAFSFRLRRANIADLAQEYLKSIGQAGGPKDGKQQI